MKKSHKIFRALKAAAEYFTTGAGVVSLVIGFVALAVFVPPFISVPIILVVGGVCAYVGGRRKWNQMKEREAKATALDLERQEVNQKHEETLRLNRSLDQRMLEIADAERNIQLKLDERLELESKHEAEHQETLLLNRNLDKKMLEIADAERSIQLKLDAHLELESRHEAEHKQAQERQQKELQCLEKDRASETPVVYPNTAVSQSLDVSQGYHSANGAQVTIRISNLPTFFMVDSGGRNSPARRGVAPSESGAEVSHKSKVCP